MEQPINAHRSGIVSGLNAQTGETVASGTTLCEILDEAGDFWRAEDIFLSTPTLFNQSNIKKNATIIRV